MHSLDVQKVFKDKLSINGDKDGNSKNSFQSSAPEVILSRQNSSIIQK